MIRPKSFPDNMGSKDKRESKLEIHGWRDVSLYSWHHVIMIWCSSWPSVDLLKRETTLNTRAIWTRLRWFLDNWTHNLQTPNSLVPDPYSRCPLYCGTTILHLTMHPVNSGRTVEQQRGRNSTAPSKHLLVSAMPGACCFGGSVWASLTTPSAALRKL